MLSTTTFFTYLVLGLAALAPIVNAGPSHTTRGDLTNPQGITARSLARRIPQPQTNAERFRRGLGPAPPKRRYNRSRLQARQSAAPCSRVTGVIAATINSQSGFIAQTINTFGEYGFTTSKDSALRVSFCSSDGNPFSITPVNGGSTAHPYLGFFQGYASTDANLSPTNYNYIYLGGTDHTDPHSPPLNGGNTYSDVSGHLDAIESSIWNIGPGGSLTVSWVNTDGSVPTNKIIYASSANAFAITGNANLFQENFGSAPSATLKFVPDS